MVASKVFEQFRAKMIAAQSGEDRKTILLEYYSASAVDLAEVLCLQHPPDEIEGVHANVLEGCASMIDDIRASQEEINAPDFFVTASIEIANTAFWARYWQIGRAMAFGGVA